MPLLFRPASPRTVRHTKLSLINQCHAADILPVYHLGDSQLFNFKGFPWLSRKLRMSLGVIWGCSGLPLPRQHDLIALVGYPIKGASRDTCTCEIDCTNTAALTLPVPCT